MVHWLLSTTRCKTFAVIRRCLRRGVIILQRFVDWTVRLQRPLPYQVSLVWRVRRPDNSQSMADRRRVRMTDCRHHYLCRKSLILLLQLLLSNLTYIGLWRFLNYHLRNNVYCKFLCLRQSSGQTGIGEGIMLLVCPAVLSFVAVVLRVRFHCSNNKKSWKRYLENDLTDVDVNWHWH